MWRVARAFAQGRGSLTTSRESVGAESFDDALGSQLVRFASIGAVSTLVFGALLAVLWGPLGPYGADVVALVLCSLANTAANRRLTFALRGRASRVRHYAAGLTLAALPLVLNLVTLVALRVAGTATLTNALVWLTVANALATFVRFTRLRRWVFRS
jgi:putative flippase GtrA